MSIVAIGLLAAVWFSFQKNVLAPVSRPGVPGILAGMKLRSVTEGEEAMARVNQLHGTGIELSDAFIAEYSYDFNAYQTNNDHVTVWVGEAESGEAAKQLTERMIRGIEKGTSVFGKPELITTAGQEVYQVRGPGGEHFFYISKKNAKQVIWAIISSSNPSTFLNAIVAGF